MDAASTLALANGVLSTAALACLVAGYRAIRRRAIARHRNFMVAAFACSAAFLIVFTLRFVTFGFRPFAGTGAWRGVYYGLLFTHEPIAVISVPLGIVALGLGLARARAHREVARPTAIIWGISAATGVLLYLLLYLTPI
jgi:putative membrane protein